MSEMEVIYLNHASKQMNKDPHVMAIGFFDGVHLGHQELLNHARSLAFENKVLFTALTFSPHPDEVIKGEIDREYLTPLPQKIEKMASLGVEKLFVMTFDKSFASLAPIDFIKEYIVGKNIKHVVVGFDFTFGYKAQGDTKLLQEHSNNGKYGLSIIPKKMYMDEKISSTLLRKLIGDGEVGMVPYYLGENHQVKVKTRYIKAGKRMTVQAMSDYILPKPGRYHVKIVDGDKTTYGEFVRCANAELDNEIIMSELQSLHQELTIVFLNKVLEDNIISI